MWVQVPHIYLLFLLFHCLVFQAIKVWVNVYIMSSLLTFPGFNQALPSLPVWPSFLPQPGPSPFGVRLPYFSEMDSQGLKFYIAFQCQKICLLSTRTASIYSVWCASLWCSSTSKLALGVLLYSNVWAICEEQKVKRWFTSNIFVIKAGFLIKTGQLWSFASKQDKSVKFDPGANDYGISNQIWSFFSDQDNWVKFDPDANDNGLCDQIWSFASKQDSWVKFDPDANDNRISDQIWSFV